MKYKVAIGSAVLLAIACLVNAAFLHSALSDGYRVSEIKGFLIPIEAARDRIEKTLGTNRRLSIADMRRILELQQQEINRHWKETRPPEFDDRDIQALDLVNISIILKSGSKLVTTASASRDRDIPAELVDQIADISTGKTLTGLEFVEDEKSYYVPYPLFDNQGRWFVSLAFQFRKDALGHSVSSKLALHFAPMLAIGVFSILAIFLLNYQLARDKRQHAKKDFVVDFVVVMLITLSCSLLINTVVFERQILEASTQNARDKTAEISAELNDRLSQRKSGADSQKRKFAFIDSFAMFDNFESVTLADSSGRVIFERQPGRPARTSIESLLQAVVVGHLAEAQFRVSEKLEGLKLKNGSDVTAVIRISKDDIFKNSVSMLVKGVTVLFITILVMVECLLLYLHMLAKKKSPSNRAPRYELGFVRPAMFLFLFAIDLSMSFLPLHMQSFDTERFGLSRDIIMGLPISAEFLCVGIFLLVAGVWTDRRGWHEPFFIGLLVVGVGTLFSWATDNALLFILSRALVGVGYGLTLMSAQGLVVNFSGTEGRARGFASLFAGLYSGSICGAAAGAILAERYGYGKVFMIAAVVVLCLFAFAWYFMRSAIASPGRKTPAAATARQKVRLAPLLKFIGNPVFLALNLLSSLPASIAVAGFLHFFTPVYMDEIGARDSTIGQVLILYGICLIYFGPPIGRMIDRSDNKKYYLLTGGLLGGLAFASFNTDLGIWSIVVSVFLLGLSSSFVLSSQSTLVLELKQSRALGEGTALGIFRSISRIGQVIGPMIFGWILLTGELNDVINYLGYTYIGAMLILAPFLINHSRREENQKLAFQN